jgi:hypothetical protein
VAVSATQRHTKLLHESYLRALQEAEEEESPVVKPTTNDETVVASLPAIPESQPPPTHHAASPLSLVQSQPSVPSAPITTVQIPDFLAGFEKALQNTKPPAVSTAAMPSLPFSPTFTSRSFEDFHRFLGNASILDASKNISKASAVVGPETTTNFVHDTTALFTADSYAMFAQQSAMEASRHGAYFIPGEPQLPTAYIQKGVTLDVDGMLKLVSEHAFGSSVTTVSTQQEPPKVQKPRKTVTIPRASVTFSVYKKAEQPAATADQTKTKEHTPAVERFENANMVSGSEPSGSSSSRSPSNLESSSATDTGTSNDDDSEGGSNNSVSISSGDGPQRKKVKFTEGTKNGDQRTIHY